MQCDAGPGSGRGHAWRVIVGQQESLITSDEKLNDVITGYQPPQVKCIGRNLSDVEEQLKRERLEDDLNGERLEDDLNGSRLDANSLDSTMWTDEGGACTKHE